MPQTNTMPADPRRAFETLVGVLNARRICVADAEGLLLLKPIAFRPRDQEDVRGILAANPGSLDLDWVRREWSALSSPNDPKTLEFERILREFYRESRD